MLLDQNVISQVAIFDAFDNYTLSLDPRLAPIRSKRGILVVERGATLDLQATRWTETVSSLYSYL